jgi:hypothetical protein
MWVQALAVAAGAVAIAGLGHVPVAVAVRSVAVPAESCVVAEPGGVNLGEAQGRPECLGDLAGPAGVDGIAVTVVGCDALEQEIPLSRLASPHDGGLHSARPSFPLGGHVPGSHELDAGLRRFRIRRREESPPSAWPCRPRL